MLLTRDKSFYKQFFSLYWVLVLHNVIVLLVNLADNVMIGSYSEISLSGVAAVNQLQFIFMQIIMSTGNGLVMFGSQYWGQGRTNEIKKVSSGALIIGLSVSFVLFTLACITPRGLVRIFSPTDAIICEGVKYINIIKFTYPVFAMTNILLATLRCVETVKIGFYISLVTLFTNCSINYLLIYGKFGFPEMGVEGAAIGTLAARVIELVIVLSYVLFKDTKLRMKISEMFSSDKALFAHFIKVATPTILAGTMFGVSTALQTVVLGHMSDSAIAANSMASTLYQTLKVVAVGAASATSVIIGKAVGQGDMKKIREYTKTLQIMFLCIGAVMSVSLFALRTPVLSLYDMTAETKALANAFLIVLCFTGFGMAYEMPTIVGIIQGGGDSKFIFKNDFVSIWFIVVPLSFLAAFKFGWHPVAVLVCLNSDQVFKCIPGCIKVNGYTWVKRLTKD